MTCSACSNGLERYLNKQNGIMNASVNLVMATVLIEYDEKLKLEDLEKFVEEAGFKSLGEKREKKENKSEFKTLIIFSVLGSILMYISMGTMLNLPVPNILNMESNPNLYTTFLLILATFFLFFGKDIIKNGIKNIYHRIPNMDSLVGIGVIINYLYSLWNTVLIFNGNMHSLHQLYFEASAMIILFVKIGRYIDKRNKIKAVDTIRNLVTITPKNATIIRQSSIEDYKEDCLVTDAKIQGEVPYVIKEGKEITVTINQVQKGDIIVCRPGEKIAVDGTVLKGSTHIDESFITGESKPVSKTIGSKVIAGSINYDGYIEYKAEKIGKESSISNIVQMVVQATNTKAPIARLADKISGYFVPAIFVISIISFILNLILTTDITKAILALVSVLVVACPCSLGLATPLAMVVSIGKCSRKGILIKSSESLESINKINTVVFDKTGTLTGGKLVISDGKYTQEQMKILQSLESKSNHPIAKSICIDKKEGYEVTDFEEIPGMGIKARVNGEVYFAGNNKFVKTQNIENTLRELEVEYTNKGESIVYLFTEKEVLAIVGLSDKIKPNMDKVIKRLQEINKKVIMLTGDNSDTANIIAKKLNIKEVISNVSPEEKLERIKELNKENGCMMIGDGINDSPALKSAIIGVSVQNGTDISADASDIILLNENMELIPDIFSIGKNTIKIIKQNLFWAVIYNILMIPFATGIFWVTINPMMASFAMTISSLTVVVNSLRLR